MLSGHRPASPLSLIGRWTMPEITYRSDPDVAIGARPHHWPGNPIDSASPYAAHKDAHKDPPEFTIAAPSEPPTAKLVVAFAFAQLALFVALLGPVTVSMAIKVTALVGADHAPTSVGVILGVGAIAALVGNPIFGRISDRTTGRWGRRRPWMVGGSLGLAVCLVVIALAGNVVTLVVAWFVAQLAANACFAAYLATVADQIPPRQSATITSLAGVMQSFGILGDVS